LYTDGKNRIPSSFSYPARCNLPGPELYCTAQLQKGQQQTKKQPFATTTYHIGSPNSHLPTFSSIADLGLLNNLHLLLMASMTSSELLPRRLFYFE